MTANARLNSSLLLALLFACAFLGPARIIPAQTWTADNGNGTYSNPLFYDEFADPDIIRVGSDFYLLGSSMHAMPGLALLHSRDLVNWDFESYAEDKLDLGPEYRLEDGKNIYGNGIWAPSLRYHNGTFYIFANVNGRTTQMYHAKSPLGPWTHTEMKRAFHDLGVLFDDDGRAYVVFGYEDLHIAELTPDLTDAVPGTERALFSRDQGMGEGSHFYKINGKYYILSAWYNGVMRLVGARAEKLSGPWEVNRNISVGEQFGQSPGWRLSAFRPPLATLPPYKLSPPDNTAAAVGRMAIHQGGIVETTTGEWWGLSMGEENAIGRVVTLSPITWQDGWPYFGLPGNLGRSPRIWVKPKTGTIEKPHAPYVRSDDFSKPQLNPVWQWNHVPADGKWTPTDRPGFLRLHALTATSLWDARDSLTQRAIGPRSIPTAVMETAGMQPGDVAGLALLIQPDAWIGVERTEGGFALVQHDGQTMNDQRVPITATRVWLRADCEYLSQLAQFSYSTDGKNFTSIGGAFRMLFIGVTFQGVRYALFNFHRGDGDGGYADFDSFDLKEPSPHGITRPIPYGKRIELSTKNTALPVNLVVASGAVSASSNQSTPFSVVDQKLGRVALKAPVGYLSVAQDGRVSLKAGVVGTAETFQWIETMAGDLTLMSLETDRYLRVDFATGKLFADSPGPEPTGPPGVRFDWH